MRPFQDGAPGDQQHGAPAASAAPACPVALRGVPCVDRKQASFDVDGGCPQAHYPGRCHNAAAPQTLGMASSARVQVQGGRIPSGPVSERAAVKLCGRRLGPAPPHPRILTPMSSNRGRCAQFSLKHASRRNVSTLPYCTLLTHASSTWPPFPQSNTLNNAITPAAILLLALHRSTVGLKLCALKKRAAGAAASQSSNPLFGKRECVVAPFAE
ncbi:hypothetical protein CC78DRAFT_581433 [Lojkania enalia]|uniref:Uncharacterized protein n=1 Tax=Lojkania enalia TaxID=147567 RepID=A0A9P4KCH4_9PLEO|nr:hypothetical protein CC78DRAFT_581433 [Didymosphaeria enalia]